MRRASAAAALQERERRDGAGRVVRIVQPQDRRAIPLLRRDAVEVGEEAGRLVSGRRTTSPPAKRAPRSGIGVAGRRHERPGPVPRPDRAPPARARRRAPCCRASGQVACRDRAPHRTAAGPSRRSPRRSSGRPAARGYDEVGTIASRRASRMNAGVSSRGSPTPKSISSRPASNASCLRRSSSSNGYGSAFRIPGDSRINPPPPSPSPRGTPAARRRTDERRRVDAFVVAMSVLRVARSEVDRVDADRCELRHGGPRLLRGPWPDPAARNRVDQRVVEAHGPRRRVADHRELGVGERRSARADAASASAGVRVGA